MGERNSRSRVPNLTTGKQRFERGREVFHETAYLVAHAAVNIERFLVRVAIEGEARRIVEGLVDQAGSIWKGRAEIVGLPADGHDGVEGDGPELRDGLRTMGGDVDADFLHDLHGERVEALRDEPGGRDVIAVAEDVPRPAFGHLAPAGISRAEKEDSFLRHALSSQSTGFSVREFLRERDYTGKGEVAFQKKGEGDRKE